MEFISSLARDSDDSVVEMKWRNNQTLMTKIFLMIPKKIKIRPTATD